MWVYCWQKTHIHVTSRLWESYLSDSVLVKPTLAALFLCSSSTYWAARVNFATAFPSLSSSLIRNNNIDINSFKSIKLYVSYFQMPIDNFDHLWCIPSSFYMNIRKALFTNSGFLWVISVSFQLFIFSFLVNSILDFGTPKPWINLKISIILLKSNFAFFLSILFSTRLFPHCNFFLPFFCWRCMMLTTTTIKRTIGFHLIITQVLLLSLRHFVVFWIWIHHCSVCAFLITCFFCFHWCFQVTLFIPTKVLIKCYWCDGIWFIQFFGRRGCLFFYWASLSLSAWWCLVNGF